MAVVDIQPIEYINPIESFILNLGVADRLENSKKVNIIFNKASVDHSGNAMWQLRAEDENKVAILEAKLNGKGICTITRSIDNADPVCEIQLSLVSMYSYDHPFAHLSALNSTNPVAEFRRKAWGVWMNTPDGQEIASYLMSTAEQFRLCCVGTVINSEYDMTFNCNGSKVAKVKNDLIADRIYSFDPFFDKTNGHLNRALAKIEFNQHSNPFARVLCIFTLLALSCYNLVTFFNPVEAPPKRRKRRR